VDAAVSVLSVGSLTRAISTGAGGLGCDPRDVALIVRYDELGSAEQLSSGKTD
jgi:hypothetical protein